MVEGQDQSPESPGGKKRWLCARIWSTSPSFDESLSSFDVVFFNNKLIGVFNQSEKYACQVGLFPQEMQKNNN